MLGDLAYWIPDDSQAWVKADLVHIDKESKEVKVKNPAKEGDTLTFKKHEVHSFDVTHQQNFHDLCKMNDLHEAPLLNLLKRRYMEDEIYTTAGSMILVSVNPYKAIPGLYDNPLKYFDLPEDGDEGLSDVTLPPHVYKVANQTLHSMLSFKEGTASSTAHNFGDRLMNQSIIVSGESGAGKTEASKKVMNFLVQANIQLVKPLEDGEKPAGRRASVNMMNDALGMVAHKIQEEILGSNFIFESFGNAKTVRNDNSSRFGKYIKLQYSGQDLLVSAYTDTFLLEKSRLLAVAQGESNYHVLYQLVAAAASGDLSAEMTEKLRLQCGSAEEGFKRFSILTAPDNECYWKSDESGQEFNLKSLTESLNATGFSPEEQENLWTLLAVILHLGNVELSGGEDGEKTVMKCASMPIEEMARLLGLEETTFQDKMTIQLVTIRGRSSIATKQLNRKETRNNVNAYIKMVYSSIFNYIVHKINYSHSLLSSMAKLKAEKFIGILDIFGFEIMKKNSFEQLCINYANERLQQHFNKNVFVKEKEEYHSQGLDATFITYADNQDVIDLLISKPNGMFAIMNDLAKINKTDDGIFLKNTQKAHVTERGQPPPAPGTPSARYEMPTTTKHIEFRVRHFAGTVVYTVGAADEPEASFLMKNNDSLQEGLEQTVVLSTNKFFNNVGGLEIGMEGIGEAGEPGFVPKFANTGMNAVEVKEGEEGGNEDNRRSVHKQMAAATTVSTTFMTQVEDLMRVLRETEPHYIKCMKPNTRKITHSYDGQLMLQQLRYSGVLEVVRIRREGYPWNATFSGFYSTFDLLSVYKQLRDGWPNPAVLKEEADCENKAKAYAIQMLEEHFSSEEDRALYAIGNTRIYMKEEGFNRLQIEITHILDRVASTIQKNVRRRNDHKWFNTTKRWVNLHQRLARGKLGRVTFQLKFDAHKADVARIAAEKAAEEERKRREEEERLREEEERLRLEAIEKAKRDAEEAEVARLEAEAEAARLAEEERLRKIAEEEERKRKEEEERLRLIEEEKQRRRDYHAACMKGDYDSVVAMTGQLPELMQSLHPDDNALRRLPLAKAASSRCLRLLQFFNPSPADVFRVDGAGMNSLHAACTGAKLAEGESPIAGGHMELLPCLQYLVRAASDYPLEQAFGTMQVSGPRNVQRQDHVMMGGRGGPTGAIMKEGYLSKKHESFFSTTNASSKSAWCRRWIRLTDEAIYYFRSEEDAQREMPRDTISFTKNMGKMTVEYYKGFGNQPAVKISFSQASGYKKRTVLNLMASDQREMDEWAKPLQQLSGMMNGDFQPDAKIVAMDRLGAYESKALLSATTAKGDHPINLLAQTLPVVTAEGNGIAEQDYTTSTVAAMAWLVSSGSFVDERGSSAIDGSASPRGPGTGATALETSLFRGNFGAGVALCKLGAMVTPSVGESLKANLQKGIITRQQEPVETIQGVDFLFRNSLNIGQKKAMSVPHKAMANYQRNLYIPNYSYLSIHFQKMSLNDPLQVWTTHTDPAARYQPCLKVSLLDRQDALVEHPSLLSVPVVQHKPLEMSDMKAKELSAAQRYIWWGKSSHVETPLDYLPDGCNFTFEYRKDTATLASGVSVEAVGRFTLNFAALKTSGHSVRVPMTKAGSTAVCGFIECEVVISTLR